MNEVKDYYKILAQNAKKEIQTLTKRIWWIGSLRLVIVVGGAIAIWLTWWNVWVMIVTLGAFLALVKVHDRLFRRRSVQENYVQIAKDNECRICLDLKNLPDGGEYIDTRHPYSYDLDIFGKKSIFSLLDTTCYRQGGKRLAHWLISPGEIKNDIVSHQESAKELREMNELRNRFRAQGIEINKGLKDKKGEIVELPKIEIGKIWKYIARAWLPIMVVALILTILEVITFTALGGMFVAGIIIGTLQGKMVSKNHKELTKLVDGISSFSPLLEEIENAEFKSEYLKELQKSLWENNVKASEATKKLNNIVSDLDQRYNVVGLILLNGAMLWDYNQISAAQKWIEKWGDSVLKWQESLATFDALSAIATFSFNHPFYTFPELDNDGITIIEGENLGHPLILQEKCVCNGVRNIKNGNFLVITGANMAGKSTYLRTIGVNYILASIGAPVYATKMIFSPVTLCTGLRTTDSLQENESYFFAELFRLRSIIERAEKGERIFVILDEILKGTNSVDKQKGSLGLVRRFVTHNVAGIIATHDLMLGTLADEFPENVSNYCFEAMIQDDKLDFSYKIQPGIAQNMNAYFLMKKMGIVS